ncbi:hypothetical protein GPECTOR_73g649 [Gonium pectorale]|uniref:Uncharacterized protein n=1 Tax=Gonium pectorale TaxID=33097 RepID=A0A150G2Q8_GONPE|nr:hypothetical protein GPECTOR_73g649 [Gonium pectorale]|eukprot:KXZ44128.1 hypothetical protein GPECTOR_73g649 [Gonium pectorale]
MSNGSAERVWSQLPLDIAERIADCMDPNEVAIYFRPANKATAQLRCPKYTIVHLSQPVPPHAFAAHWLAPGATRGLTLKQRRQLLSLTAASGVVANLEVAEQAAGCVLTYEVFQAAAAAGKLESCQWLRGQGCPMEECEGSGCGLLGAAAAGGHRHVCEWLLGLGLAWSSDGVAEAARGGHVGLMEWLQERRHHMRLSQDVEVRQTAVVKGAAHGCDLATLQRIWQDWGYPTDARRGAVLASAAGSPTPDWSAKVEWLEAQGCRPAEWVTREAAGCPDAPARLAWLRGRGYPLGRFAVEAAACAGGVAALQYLLVEVGVRPEVDTFRIAAAPERRRLAALQALHAAGILTADCARGVSVAAACGGHLRVVAWLLDTFGRDVTRLDSYLFSAAAACGSVELLAWLRRRRCAWFYQVLGGPYTSAARSGCVAALEWLAAQGCPMPVDGSPYVAACANGDLAAARCLRRLGVPWGPAGVAVKEFVYASGPDYAGAPFLLLRWLLEEGCPVDLAALGRELEVDEHALKPGARGALSRLLLLQGELGTEQLAEAGFVHGGGR